MLYGYQPYYQMQQPIQPIQQPVQQMQPMQQQVFAPAKLPGRVVNDVSEIVANEVPMDGSVSLFPSKDYSVIYAKQWKADGNIQTVKYVPEKMEETAKEPDLMGVINKRFDNIEKLLKPQKDNRREKVNE